MNQVVVIAIMMAVILPFSSCKHQTLRIFFDGVDKPQKEEILKSNFQKDISDSLQTEKIEMDTIIQVKSIHTDYKKRSCSKCHQVQQSYRLATRQPDLCYQCHKPYSEKYDVLHGPVAAGFCTACHQPHQSHYNYLLRMPVREACTFCHSPGDVKENQAHNQINTTECIKCHNSHGGKTHLMIKDEAS